MYVEANKKLPEDLILLKKFANYLDDFVKIPGTKQGVGLDPLISLIPIVGDIFGAILGLWIVILGLKYRIPMPKIITMIFHVLFDVLLGAIPFLGNIIDVFWRSNTRNANYVLEHWESRMPPRDSKQVFFLGSIISLTTISLSVLIVLIFIGSAIAIIVSAAKWILG